MFQFPGKEEKFDLTDVIAYGNLREIIKLLIYINDLGFDQLHWDGYDSSIHAYRSKEKKEEVKSERNCSYCGVS